jgi:hypothetical protein
MIAPAANITTASPTIIWIGDDVEPTDEFVDALVALLWSVVEKRAAAADDTEAGRNGDNRQRDPA